METKQKWYQKSWATILFLILFFPAGLFLMWKYTNWSHKVKWIITGIFAFLIIINGATGGSSQNQTSTPEPPTATETKAETKPTEEPSKKPSQHELQAEIKFSEIAFQITNTEDLDWTGCRLEMNSGIIRGGYTYTTDLIPSKDPLIIPFREFTKGDGTRFNPYDTKAQNLSISCQVGGEHGFGYYGIN